MADQDVAETLILSLPEAFLLVREIRKRNLTSKANVDFLQRALEGAERNGRSELLMVIKRT